jgi:hypothetical protein
VLLEYDLDVEQTSLSGNAEVEPLTRDPTIEGSILAAPGTVTENIERHW